MSLQSFTGNQKTILSIDFDRGSTCMQTCSYCYVNNMERIYPSYLGKVQRNSELLKTFEGIQEFTTRLNDEYRKARKSKSKQYERLEKLPVRIYGAGDFIPIHIEFLKNLNFKFFMISKNLTTDKLSPYIHQLLEIPNLTSLRLSFDDSNMENYEKVKHLHGSDRIGFTYTGLPDHFQEWKEKGFKFDMFFNISHKKEEINKARAHKERCPVDTDNLALQKACTYCARCWRSSVTKNSNWNKIN